MLSPKTAAVPGKVAIASNHAMAWNHNRDAVVSVGARYSPHPCRHSDLTR
jgi:hypothetical protein